MMRMLAGALLLVVAIPVFAEDQPPDAPGVWSVGGEYLGANLKEAREAGKIPAYDPATDPLVQQHGADKVYFNPDTGDSFIYGDGHGNVVTKEQSFAIEAANNTKANAAMRAVLGGADDPSVDSQSKSAISQTQALIEKTEREQAAELARQREEAKKYVPARVLISDENGKRELSTGSAAK